jgi:Fe-Mn family superoxide dismutase
MNKRDFIKTGLIGTIGLVAIPSLVRGNNRLSKSLTAKKFNLPPLPYAYDALEPHMDKETLLLHHTQHHQAYTDKLNAAIQEQDIAVSNVREILENASKYNETILKNGGGYLNHRLFWKMLSPNGGGNANGNIANAINSDFGSFEKFKIEFTKSARSLSGSGWVWLVNRNGKLKIITTADQENPFMETLPSHKKGFPIMCLDVWEHSYYLKYQDNRSDYVDAFWKIINWDTVNLRFNKSIA